MNSLVLFVDGRPYSGFKEVTLLRSMLQGPHQFELSIGPDLGTDASVFDIEDGMSCQCYIDDDLVITGYVDDRNASYNHQNHEITISGRSKLADLVDCSTHGLQLKAGQTLLSVARQLCKPYGISVSADSSASAAANQPFSATDLALDPGQTVWDFLEELARIRAVLLISDSAGNLVITRAGAGRADSPLILGQNIKSAAARRSHRSLFSDITVAGMAATWSVMDATGNSQAQASVSGQARRYRQRVIITDQPVDIAACKQRADWQRRVDWGRSRSIDYTLRGWRQGGDTGRVWMPNETTVVTDTFSQLNADTRLIASVRQQFTRSSGRTTTLTVMPPSAFDLLAQPESGANV